MQRFELHRDEDQSGVSGIGIVAEGVVFHDGTVALRWRTQFKSTALYATVDDMHAIHGHNGMTRIVWITDSRIRGRVDAMQDRCENLPFNQTVPEYISKGDEKEYTLGYKEVVENVMRMK